MAAPKTHTPPRRILPRLSWRAVLLGIAKWAAAIIVTIDVLYKLTDSTAGLPDRAPALAVVVLSCCSLAYFLFVSSRVRLRLPGIEEKLREARAEAGRRSSPDEELTIQITRLSPQAARVVVVNEAPLPVLRARTSVALVSEPEDARGTVAQETQLVMGPEFSLRARGTRQTALAKAFDHVGVFHAQSAGVRVFDLIGLFSRVCGTPGRWRVRVVPNIYRITYGIPRDRTVAQSSLGIPDAPADALDYDRVRDYRPGDPLKTIHWKLVAHGQGDLYTKLFETSTITSASLTFDPYGPSAINDGAERAYHLYDTMLEGAFSLMEHARENGISGRLRFVSRTGGLTEVPWAGPGLLGWFVETARRPSRSREDRERSIAAIRALRDMRGGYVIFATSSLTEASTKELIACRNAGVSLLVVHALSGHGPEDERQRALGARLRAESVVVVALTDGRRIAREVSVA